MVWTVRRFLPVVKAARRGGSPIRQPNCPALSTNCPPRLPNCPSFLPNRPPLVPNRPSLLPRRASFLPLRPPRLPRRVSFFTNRPPPEPNQPPRLPNRPDCGQCLTRRDFRVSFRDTEGAGSLSLRRRSGERVGERANLLRLGGVLSASSPRPSPPIGMEEREFARSGASLASCVAFRNRAVSAGILCRGGSFFPREDGT